MLARDKRAGVIALFARGSVAEKEYGIESAAFSGPKFRSTSFGFHQFLNDGESEASSSQFTAFIGGSPETVKSPLSLFVSEARTLINDVNSND
jgi:hypothetical protein